MILKHVVEDQQRTSVSQRLQYSVHTCVRYHGACAAQHCYTSRFNYGSGDLQFFSYPLQNKCGPNTCPLNIIYTFGA
jgi:hypothetical protein